jgi:cytoskeleton protein RodZ
MGSFASELKSEREKRNVSLAQIATETRISLRHLESLEEGRYGDLPGGIYNRAFLKAYCEFLNLDPTHIMQRYEDEISAISERALKSKVHIPQQTRSLSISPTLVWGFLVLISATGLFFSRNWIAAIFSPYFSHTPVTTARYESVKPAGAPKHSETHAPIAAPPVRTPAQPETTITQPALQNSPSSTVPDAPAPAAPARSGEASNAPATPSTIPTMEQILRLEISVTEKCWVSIDRDGTPVFRKIMEPGEVQSFRAAEKYQIVLGNAGGVQLKINGQPAKSLGKPGEVVKILIDRHNLQDILAQTAG